jgi:pimeloyl-ACP methyl ester carboxylesterase
MKRTFLVAVLSLTLGLTFGLTPSVNAQAPAPTAQTDSTSGYAQIGPLKMYYEIHGKGFPLVLIHGGGSTIGTSFGHVIDAFARHHMVIAVELQAHGHTQDIDRPLSFGQDADDIAALLQQLHITQADFYGFSNGGHTAMMIGIRHPSLVHKLVIGSAFFKRSGAYDWFWPGFDHATLDMMPKYLRDAYLNINHDSAGLRNMFTRDMTRMMHFQDFPDADVNAVKAPTLFIIGDQDLVRPEYAVSLTRTMPHARLIILPGKHGEYLEGSGSLPLCAAGMVEDFLSGQ